MKKNHWTRKALPLLLALSMIVTTGLTSMLVIAEEGEAMPEALLQEKAERTENEGEAVAETPAEEPGDALFDETIISEKDGEPTGETETFEASEVSEGESVTSDEVVTEPAEEVEASEESGITEGEEVVTHRVSENTTEEETEAPVVPETAAEESVVTPTVTETATEEPVVTPAATETATEEPVVITAAPEAVPTVEPAAEETVAEEMPAFNGRVSISYGYIPAKEDAGLKLVLTADVTDAGTEEYTLSWEKYNEEDEVWLSVGCNKDSYFFELTRDNLGEQYRVALNVGDITVYSSVYEVAEIPAEEQTEAEPEEVTAGEEIAAENTEEPADESPATVKTPAEATEKVTVVYGYERDENGNLVLDAFGNPTAIVPEGADIPVKYQKDENGFLVLDEDGNPIVIETVPAGSELIDDAEFTDEETEEITGEVRIYRTTSGPIYKGDVVTYVAVVDGFEGINWYPQWQRDNGNGWTDLAGENGMTLNIIASDDNYTSYWRVVLLVNEEE